MSSLVRWCILCLAIVMPAFPARAAEVSKEQLKSLDEQVQDVKTDTLKTGANLHLLEEKLLYPSSTQVAVYVSLDGAAAYHLDTMEVQLDGKRAAQHLYSAREHEALLKGGMQRIYAGNITSGEHTLEVAAGGKTASGAPFRKTDKITFTKNAGAKVVEVHLAASGDKLVTFRDW